MRSGNISRTSTSKRGDRHFDVAGGISGSFLHPKVTTFKPTYMSKQEMTYWQLVHRIHSAHDEKKHTSDDLNSKERQTRRKVGPTLTSLAKIVAVVAGVVSLLQMSNSGNLFWLSPSPFVPGSN